MYQLVDTNYLRKQSDESEAPLETELKAASPDDRFVIPDGVIIETMKNERWESTARQSFEIISRYPDMICTATERSQLLTRELESGSDTTEVIDSGLTQPFRALLREIATGADGEAMNHIRKEIIQAHANLDQQQLNHDQNLDQLKGAFESVNDFVKRDAYRRSLSEDQKREFRLRYAKTLALQAAKDVPEQEGKDPAIGDALAAGRGFMIRQHIGFTLLGFKWFENQGLDSFPAHKATNEMMDLYHVVVSTFCDGILSKEPWLATMRQDILDALDLPPLPLSSNDTNTSD